MKRVRSGWWKESNSDVALKILLFFASPFLAFIYSFRRLNTRSSYIVVFLFFCCFGLAFSVPSGRDASSVGYDGQVYRQKFEYYQHVHPKEFREMFEEYISFESGRKDFFFDVFAFSLSRVTNNYHVMFGLLAAIFAIFMLGSTSYLTKDERFNSSVISFLLLYLFTFNQIFNINGIRFWLAAWVTVFCVFKILRDKNSYYFLLLLITPFIHGSYWIAIFLVLISLTTAKFERAWVVLYASSFILSYFAPDILQSFQNKIPYYMSRSIQAYTDSEYIELRNSWSGVGIFRVLFEDGRYLFINLLTALIIYHSKDARASWEGRYLYGLLLVWMTFVNFTMSVPSLGGRYIEIMYPIIAYMWLIVFESRRYTVIILFLPFFFAYPIYSQIIKYANVIDIEFIFSSPFYLIYEYILDV